MSRLLLITTAPAKVADVTCAALRRAALADPLASRQLVTPSRPVGRSIAQRVAGAGLRYATLPELARALAETQAGPQSAHFLPPLADQLLVAQLLDRDPGPYAERALRPAIVAALTRLIRDLREAGAERIVSSRELDGPVSLERARLDHLSRIYDRYLRHLQSNQLEDEAALYARAACAKHEAPVFLHAIYDLTGVQRVLVQALARSVDITWVLPRLASSRSEKLLTETVEWAEGVGFAVEELADEVGASAEESGLPKVLACPGDRAEAREVARGVLAAAARGMSFADVAVITAQPPDGQKAFVRELERAGIPVTGPRDLGWLDDPRTRAIDALLRVVRHEAQFADALALVSEVVASERTPLMSAARVGYHARRAGIADADPGSWRERLNALARSLGHTIYRLESEERDEETGRHDRIETLKKEQRLLRKLATRAEVTLGRAHKLHDDDGAPSWRQLAADLVDLLSRLHLTEPISSRSKSCAKRLAQLEQLNVKPRAELALIAWQRWLNDALADEETDADATAPGETAPRRVGEAVLLIDINRARGLRAPFVWCAGLAQELLAPPPAQDPILGDRMRWWIRELTGLPLKLAHERLDENDLLFQLAVAAGERCTVVSWPRLEDASGQIRQPATPLADLIESVSGELLRPKEPSRHPAIERVPVAIPDAGDPDRPLIDAAELALSLTRGIDGAAGARLPNDERLLRCLAAHTARWESRALTMHDGIVPAGQVAPEAFSPTGLENFARCPFKFLLKQVLRLDPPASAPLVGEPEARDLGALAHLALQELFEPLVEVPVERWPALEEQLALLSDTLRAGQRKILERGATGSVSLWDATRERMEDQLAFFLIDEREYLSGRGQTVIELEKKLQKVYFSGDLDTDDCAETVAVRGRADRIDVDAESQRWVTDYKYSTGKPVSTERLLRGGQRLQLPLYAWLEFGETDRSGGVRYVYLRGGTRSVAEVTPDQLAQRRNHLDGLIGELARRVRAGGFFQVPSDDNCKFCDFKFLCGPQRERASQRKKEDPLRSAHDALIEEYP